MLETQTCENSDSIDADNWTAKVNAEGDTELPADSIG